MHFRSLYCGDYFNNELLIMRAADAPEVYSYYLNGMSIESSQAVASLGGAACRGWHTGRWSAMGGGSTPPVTKTVKIKICRNNAIILCIIRCAIYIGMQWKNQSEMSQLYQKLWPKTGKQKNATVLCNKTFISHLTQNRSMRWSVQRANEML